ncbi:MAG: putative signal transducing protein [Caulobacteraceae bacterium]
MKQIYAPANSAEAHMLAHLLEQNGIQAHIHGEALQGGVGELPASGLLQLLVADEDYDRARALIMAWERARAPEAENRSKLGVPIWMGLIVFTIGVGGGWVLRTAALTNAIPVNATEVHVDQNGDGGDDATYFFRVGAAYLHRAEFDRNYDGTVDATFHYNGEGVTTRDERDDNFDGVAESRTAYSGGNAARTEIDSNRNGMADVRIFYRHDVPTRDEIQDNRTGRVARVNHYENLRLSRSESDLDGDGFLETVRTYDELGEISGTETRQRR